VEQKFLTMDSRCRYGMLLLQVKLKLMTHTETQKVAIAPNIKTCPLRDTSSLLPDAKEQFT
jgi:hypothetical protein